MVDIVGKPRMGGAVAGCGEGATRPGGGCSLALEAESHLPKCEISSDGRHILRARRGMHLRVYGWMGFGVGLG